MLYFYRNGCVVDIRVHLKVIVDGKRRITLQNKSIESTTLATVLHTLAPRQGYRSITLDVKAGQVYIIKYRTNDQLVRCHTPVENNDDGQSQSEFKIFPHA